MYSIHNTHTHTHTHIHNTTTRRKQGRGARSRESRNMRTLPTQSDEGDRDLGPGRSRAHSLTARPAAVLWSASHPCITVTPPLSLEQQQGIHGGYRGPGREGDERGRAETGLPPSLPLSLPLSPPSPPLGVTHSQQHTPPCTRNNGEEGSGSAPHPRQVRIKHQLGTIGRARLAGLPATRNSHDGGVGVPILGKLSPKSNKMGGLGPKWGRSEVVWTHGCIAAVWVQPREGKEGGREIHSGSPAPAPSRPGSAGESAVSWPVMCIPALLTRRAAGDGPTVPHEKPQLAAAPIPAARANRRSDPVLLVSLSLPANATPSYLSVVRVQPGSETPQHRAGA